MSVEVDFTTFVEAADTAATSAAARALAPPTSAVTVTTTSSTTSTASITTTDATTATSPTITTASLSASAFAAPFAAASAAAAIPTALTPTTIAAAAAADDDTAAVADSGAVSAIADVATATIAASTTTRRRTALRMRGGGGEATVRLMTVNVRGLQLRSDERRGRAWDHLSAAVRLWRKPEQLALQECGGGCAEMGLLADALAELGYDSAWREGEPARSSLDGHRHGGVLVAWHKGAFARARGEAGLGGGGAHGVALLSREALEQMREEGLLRSAEMGALMPFAGRRAVAVRLTRKKGPLANTESWLGSVYVPAAASAPVKAAFIRVVARAVSALRGGREDFAVAGDWQAAPGPTWRLGGVANKVHDEALRVAFFGDAGGGGAGEHGAAVDWQLEHEGGVYSHHSSSGHHRTIDHLLVNTSAQGDWRRAADGFVFLGARKSGYDEHAVTDHMVGVFERDEGRGEEVEAVRKAQRLSKASLRSGVFAHRARRLAEGLPGGNAGERLAELEGRLAELAGSLKHDRDPQDRAWRRVAPAGDEGKLAYLQGLYASVSYTREVEESDPALAMRVVAATHDRGLYACNFLRCMRDRFVRRAARAPRVGGWQKLRDDIERELRQRVAAVTVRVDAARAAQRAQELRGLEPEAMGAELAGRCQAHQRRLKAAKRQAGFSVSALNKPGGGIARTCEEVLAVATAYGEKQNRASECDEEAMVAWLAAFCPRGEPLCLPDGREVTLRTAMPFGVFLRERALAAPEKAAGLHPFLVDYLQALPDDHPVLAVYYELLMQCMEGGEYPAHYLQLSAALIPKTYGMTLDMGALRDIWMINHGAKLAEKMLFKLTIAPAGGRVLTCHAGGCAGRSCAEQALALHLAIEEAHSLRSDLYVLYVDLIKCFMSFSRAAGRKALLHLGVPRTVVEALQALCEDAAGRMVTGRYETAFGASPEFKLLRGFLQGAHASPEQCKVMMNTLAEALELKTLGHSYFAPDGGGADMVSLIFVDDAANTGPSAPAMQRTALFWSVWLWLTDCRANIHAFKKTVISGVRFVRARADGGLVAKSVEAEIYIGGLERGDPPRKVPIMECGKSYQYVGQKTRMDARHLDEAIPALKAKLKLVASGVLARGTGRRTALKAAAAGVFGNGFFYGSVVGASMGEIDRELGPAVRLVARAGRLRGQQRRQLRAPRAQLHGPAVARWTTEAANDVMANRVSRRAGAASAFTGYGLPHPYPCLMAGGVSTFFTALASPLDTPARRATHAAMARILWEKGCREAPCRFDLRAWMADLDQRKVGERMVWALASFHGGTLAIEQTFGEDSPLHSSRFPGYPADWRPLWSGSLASVTAVVGSRAKVLLAKAGVAELANMCAGFGAWASVRSMMEQYDELADHDPTLVEKAIRQLRGALKAAGVRPVEGRAPWSAKAARAGKTPCYAPLGFGSVASEKHAARLRDKCSGDGLAAMAAELGLTQRPEWVTPEPLEEGQVQQFLESLESGVHAECVEDASDVEDEMGMSEAGDGVESEAGSVWGGGAGEGGDDRSDSEDGEEEVGDGEAARDWELPESAEELMALAHREGFGAVILSDESEGEGVAAALAVRVCRGGASFEVSFGGDRGRVCRTMVEGLAALRAVVEGEDEAQRRAASARRAREACATVHAALKGAEAMVQALSFHRDGGRAAEVRGQVAALRARCDAACGEAETDAVLAAARDLQRSAAARLAAVKAARCAGAAMSRQVAAEPSTAERRAQRAGRATTTAGERPPACPRCPGGTDMVWCHSAGAVLRCDRGCGRDLAEDEGRFVCQLHDLDYCKSCAGVARGEAVEGAAVESARASTLRLTAAAALGTASVRVLHEVRLPGRGWLEMDGKSRRVITAYDKNKAVGERTWWTKVTGGHHREWRGRGAVWHAWAKANFAVGVRGECIGMRGDASHPEAPGCFKFLLACEQLAAPDDRKAAGAEETAFLFARLLELERDYPVEQWCATDGSRAQHEDWQGQKEWRVARAALLYDGDELRVVGDRIDASRKGFDQHSYEAELAGFSDVYVRGNKKVTVNITDCLSGMQAGQRFRTRTDRARASCYRDDVLSRLEELEETQEAVIHVYVHSHVMILPNEIADTYAGLKLCSPAVREPDYGAKRHALAEISCLKRDVGAYAYDFFHAGLMAWLAGAVTLTIAPSPADWGEATACVARRGWLRDAEADVMSDARANRMGLLADERVDDMLADSGGVKPDVRGHMRDLEPARRTWKWAKWHELQCPCCAARSRCLDAAGGGGGRGVRAQTRWHVLTECSLAQVDGAAAEREKAVAWLDRNLDMFGGCGQARWALTALRGEGDRLQSNEQRAAALRFLLGCPLSPGEDEAGRGEAARYVCGLLRPIARMLLLVRAHTMRETYGWQRKDLFSCVRWRMLRGGADGEQQGRWLSRSKWMARRSVHEVWTGRHFLRRCVAGWRAYVATCGPRAWTEWSEGRGGEMGEGASGRGDVVRGKWVAEAVVRRVGKEWVADGEGDGLPSHDAWQLVQALQAWLRYNEADGHTLEPWARGRGAVGRVGSAARAFLAATTTARARAAQSRREEEVARCLQRMVKKVASRAVKAAAAEARHDAEVRGCLSRLIARVESEAKRGEGIWLGILARTAKRCAETRAVRRVAARVLKSGSEGAPIPGDPSAVAQATAGDYHTVERLLAVERRGRSGVWALVRWAAVADDSWVRRRDLDASSQRLADKIMRSTGRVKAAPSFARPPPRREAATRRREQLQRLRMGDGRSVARGGSAAGAPMELGEAAEGRAVKRGRVIADPPAEMDLRGDGWRQGVAARGRGVRQRTR